MKFQNVVVKRVFGRVTEQGCKPCFFCVRYKCATNFVTTQKRNPQSPLFMRVLRSFSEVPGAPFLFINFCLLCLFMKVYNYLIINGVFI